LVLGEDKIIALMERGLVKSGSTHDLDDVIQCLRDGTMQAIWNDGAVIVTQIGEYPRRRVIDVFLCAGDLDSVMALRPELLDLAKAHGCDYGRAYVRHGLVKPLQEAGWKTVQTVMTFEME
jgi:hypothetical protein